MNTKEKILSIAQHLAQQRGFNGFSYADIADKVGVRKASLHHHFASKADLGVALIDNYTAQLENELQRINQLTVATDVKLGAYIDIYRHTLVAGCLCLGGMLATDSMTLNSTMLPGLKRFFLLNRDWLASIIAKGESEAVFVLTGNANDHASALLAALQGALLIARSTGEQDTFDQTAAVLLSGLTGKG